MYIYIHIIHIIHVYIYIHIYIYMSPSCSSFKQNPFEHFSIIFSIVFLKPGPFFSFLLVPRCADLEM